MARVRSAASAAGLLMGFQWGSGSWLRQAIGGSGALAPAAQDEQVPNQPPAKLAISRTFSPCLEVAGTNTFAK